MEPFLYVKTIYLPKESVFSSRHIPFGRNPRVPCKSLPSVDLELWKERVSCTVGATNIEVGKADRISPCVMCTCTKEGVTQSFNSILLNIRLINYRLCWTAYLSVTEDRQLLPTCTNVQPSCHSERSRLQSAVCIRFPHIPTGGSSSRSQPVGF